MWPHRDTLSARLVQRSKCQIDGGTRRQHGNGRVLRRWLLPQSEALATTLNGDKPGRVKFAYEPVTQKFIALVKSKTKFTLYGDLPDILGFGAWSGDSTTSLTSSARSMFVRASSVVDLRRGFESLYVYSSIVEPRIVGDKIAPLLRIVPITGRHGRW